MSGIGLDEAAGEEIAGRIGFVQFERLLDTPKVHPMQLSSGSPENQSN